MASNDTIKKKGGDCRKKTIWDTIADYALLWEALIMGALIIVFIIDALNF